MSEQEKPLHVRVAEALGWFGYHSCALRYDTDWAATGPLIERFGISVEHNGGWWDAYSGNRLYHDGGPTPLVAVCNLILLILDIHAAGRPEK